MNDNNNSGYINILRGSAILLVVMSQVIFINDDLLKWSGAVCFPLLIGAEGIAESGKNGNATTFIKRMMLPYLLISLLMLAYNAFSILAGKDGYTSLSRVQKLVDTLTLRGVSVLWVLPAVMLGILLCRLLNKKLDPYKCMLIFFVLTIIFMIAGGKQAILQDAGRDESLTIRACANIGIVAIRSLIAALFVSTGQSAVLIRKHFFADKLKAVPFAIILFISAVVLIEYNGVSTISRLIFDKWYLYLPGVLLSIISAVWIAEWINVFKPLELIGKNAVIILVSFHDLRIMYLSLLVDARLLAYFDNRFIAHTGFFLVTCACELILITIINLIIKASTAVTGADSYSEKEN